MTADRVSLSALEELDALIAEADRYVAECTDRLSDAIGALATLRATQGRMVALYNAQAARPLGDD